jgi:hypothetical protein
MEVSALFSQTLNLCCSLSVRDHVSHPSNRGKNYSFKHIKSLDYWAGDRKTDSVPNGSKNSPKLMSFLHIPPEKFSFTLYSFILKPVKYFTAKRYINVPHVVWSKPLKFVEKGNNQSLLHGSLSFTSFPCASVLLSVKETLQTFPLEIIIQVSEMFSSSIVVQCI